MDILLICNRPIYIAGTLDHHINSLVDTSKYRIHVLETVGDIPDGLDLSRFDGLILHWSLVICDQSYLETRARERIRAFQGLKAAFIQDEYRFVDKTCAALRDLRVDVLFTCVPEEEIDKVYSEEKLPGLRKVNTLTGYVDLDLLSRDVPKLDSRSIDVGYRSRRAPFWYGELGQEKSRISDRFEQDAIRYNLITDISCAEESRIYGERWISFLTGCKAVLGVESGASVFDFDGSIQAAVERDLAADPLLGFETLQKRYFKDKEGLIRLNQISPRCFEAAALRTAMILYEGEYSGRLVAGRHYIPLKKDHSNMTDVVDMLGDTTGLQKMVDTTYEEVACDPINHFSSFARQFDTVLAEELTKLKRPKAIAYSADEFVAAIRPNLKTRIRRFLRNCHDVANKYIFGGLLAKTPLSFQNSIRAVFRFFLLPLRWLR